MNGTDRPIPIPTRFEMLTPQGVDRQYAERLVRHFTMRRVRLDDPGFDIGTLDLVDADRKRRSKLARFMAALQAELLHFENWDGTPRPQG